MHAAQLANNGNKYLYLFSNFLIPFEQLDIFLAQHLQPIFL